MATLGTVALAIWGWIGLLDTIVCAYNGFARLSAELWWKGRLALLGCLAVAGIAAVPGLFRGVRAGWHGLPLIPALWYGPSAFDDVFLPGLRRRPNAAWWLRTVTTLDAFGRALVKGLLLGVLCVILAFAVVQVVIFTQDCRDITDEVAFRWSLFAGVVVATLSTVRLTWVKLRPPPATRRAKPPTSTRPKPARKLSPEAESRARRHAEELLDQERRVREAVAKLLSRRGPDVPGHEGTPSQSRDELRGDSADELNTSQGPTSTSTGGTKPSPEDEARVRSHEEALLASERKAQEVIEKTLDQLPQGPTSSPTRGTTAARDWPEILMVAPACCLSVVLLFLSPAFPEFFVGSIALSVLACGGKYRWCAFVFILCVLDVSYRYVRPRIDAPAYHPGTVVRLALAPGEGKTPVRKAYDPELKQSRVEETADVIGVYQVPSRLTRALDSVYPARVNLRPNGIVYTSQPSGEVAFVDGFVFAESQARVVADDQGGGPERGVLVKLIRDPSVQSEMGPDPGVLAVVRAANLRPEITGGGNPRRPSDTPDY